MTHEYPLVCISSFCWHHWLDGQLLLGKEHFCGTIWPEPTWKFETDNTIDIYIYTVCYYIMFIMVFSLSDSFTTWMNSNNLSSDRRSKPDPYGCLSQNCWPPNVMVDRRVPHRNSDVVVSFGTHNWRLAAWFCHYVPMMSIDTSLLVKSA